MPAISFHCPSCDAVLRLANPVGPGKKIKCPKCATIFATPDEEDVLPTAVREQSRPLAAPRREPIVDDDDDEAQPRRSAVRSRRVADDYDRGDDEDDDRDRRDRDEDDEPRVRRSGKKIKKKAQSNALLVGLLIGGVVMLLGAGAFAGWVWPGFFKAGVPSGTGNEDVLAYLPANCPLVMGVDFQEIQALMGPDFQLNRFPGANNGMMHGLADALAKMDKMVMAARFDNLLDPDMLVILKTKVPFTEEEMRASFKAEDRQSAHGKVYYKVPVAAFNQPGMQQFGKPPASSRPFLLAFPNNRIVIFGNLPQKDMEALLASDGTSVKIPAEMSAMIHDVEKSTFWFCLHVNDSMKKLMAQNGGLGAMGPGFGGLRDAATNMKGLTGSFSLSGQLKATVSMICANAGDATKVADTLRTMWNKDGKKNVPQLAQAVRMFGSNDLARALEEACNSLTFGSSGVKAQASVTVTKATLDKAFKDMQRLGQQLGGVGAPPRMGMPAPRRPLRPGFPPGR